MVMVVAIGAIGTIVTIVTIGGCCYGRICYLCRNFVFMMDCGFDKSGAAVWAVAWRRCVKAARAVGCGVAVVALCGCGCGGRVGGSVDSVAVDSVETDSVAVAATESVEAYADTVFASAAGVVFRVDTMASGVSGEIVDFSDRYAGVPGILTFRGDGRRSAGFTGVVKGEPSGLEVDWMFKTAFDTTRTKYGTWGGGSGWTGQPLLLEWSEAQLARIREGAKDAVTEFLGPREVAVGSLCGKVYFIDFESGKASRRAFDVGNPIKGTMSFVPDYCGNLFVGHGVPAREPFGAVVLNLYGQERVDLMGRDGNAWRGWGAYDSSPVAVGDFVFRPGENGTLYKYYCVDGGVVLHSTLRYRVDGLAPGMESSMAVSRNYGFTADNRGNILAVNLSTLRPVWLYRNHDDTDATIVVEQEAGVPMLYSGCEVDKQGDRGWCYFVKLNGLTGEKVWEQRIECRKAELGKTTEGGMFSTPLLGRGDCEGLVWSNINSMEPGNWGALTAFDKRTGEVRYRVKLKFYSWSSPVALCNERGEMYVLTGDTYGNVYVVRGRDGALLFTEHVGNNFESSPIVVGNSVVVGSRGQEIYKFSIK